MFGPQKTKIFSDGGFDCECSTGYTKKKGKCTDVNECSNSPCGINASCSNTEGSFRDLLIVYKKTSKSIFNYNIGQEILKTVFNIF